MVTVHKCFKGSKEICGLPMAINITYQMSKPPKTGTSTPPFSVLVTKPCKLSRRRSVFVSVFIVYYVFWMRRLKWVWSGRVWKNVGRRRCWEKKWGRRGGQRFPYSYVLDCSWTFLITHDYMVIISAENRFFRALATLIAAFILHFIVPDMRLRH